MQNFIKTFYKENSVIMNGKISSSSTAYDANLVVSSVFGVQFKSLFLYIYDHIAENKSIHEIYELSETTLNMDSRKGDKTQSNLYIVSQTKPFLIDEHKQIYARTVMNVNTSEKDSNTKVKPTITTTDITIIVFSTKSSINEILGFLETIRNNYSKTIENNRKDSRFIYTLMKTNYDDSKYECWDETEFKTTRCFENVFFEEKPALINQLNMFKTSEQWYYDMGIPYSLGIALHGPPGTGKTSVIKCIAKMMDRHVVVLSLKLIRTKRQLNNFFFEKRYNLDNQANSIGFDKKVIVIEDIDCISDIVLDRTVLDEIKQKKQKKKDGLTDTEAVIQTLLENTDGSAKLCPLLPPEDDLLTLDDLLNLWDGILETPGRIMIISTNHYDKLDPALIRPGRIDISLKLSYASHPVIAQFYKHYYKREIDPDLLSKIKSYLYTPCEIANIFMQNVHSETQFMERLMENKPIMKRKEDTPLTIS
jgi:DNA replication protein DnaC